MLFAFGSILLYWGMLGFIGFGLIIAFIMRIPKKKRYLEMLDYYLNRTNEVLNHFSRGDIIAKYSPGETQRVWYYKIDSLNTGERTRGGKLYSRPEMWVTYLGYRNNDYYYNKKSSSMEAVCFLPGGEGKNGWSNPESNMMNVYVGKSSDDISTCRTTIVRLNKEEVNFIKQKLEE